MPIPTQLPYAYSVLQLIGFVGSSPTWYQQKVNPMSFVMYSTTWCGYCKRLKSQLADLGVTFEEINIEETPGTAEIVEKVNGGNRTVPTLVFSDGAAMTNPSAKQVTDKLAELNS